MNMLGLVFTIAGFRGGTKRRPRRGEAFAVVRNAAHAVGRLSRQYETSPTPWGDFRGRMKRRIQEV